MKDDKADSSSKSSKLKKKKRIRVQDCPAFGMSKDDTRPVEEIMDELRGGRYRDLFKL